MHNYTQAQQDAIDLLHEWIESEEDWLDGGAIWNRFNKESRRGGKVVNLLLVNGCMEEKSGHFGSGDEPTWATRIYALLPRAEVFLDNYQAGENPFKTIPQHQHQGDIYNTRVEGNTGAFAIGRQAVANNYSGISNETVRDLFGQMAGVIKELPKAEREDGEYQLSKLAEAAESGPEAVQERKNLFVRFIEGLKDKAETAQAFTLLYRVAILVFAQFQISLPELPDGI